MRNFENKEFKDNLEDLRRMPCHKDRPASSAADDAASGSPDTQHDAECSVCCAKICHADTPFGGAIVDTLLRR
jgi:hypothetical protein